MAKKKVSLQFEPINSAQWKELKVVHLLVDELVPSQSELLLERLLEADGGWPVAGDLWTHVVHFQDQFHIIDDHHKWIVKKLQGKYSLGVRLLCRETDCQIPGCEWSKQWSNKQL